MLLLALVMSSPALYRYFVAQDLDITETLGRYLIAVPIAAVMVAVFRMVVAGYGRTSPPEPKLDLTGSEPVVPVAEPNQLTTQPS